MEKNLRKGELIGRNIEITGSKNKSTSGLEGKIINETKNTITIKTKKGKKTIIKSQITFKMKNNGSTIIGEEISVSPEERIKLR
jgi:ribonuclease P protein subunit POP4